MCSAVSPNIRSARSRRCDTVSPSGESLHPQNELSPIPFFFEQSKYNCIIGSNDRPDQPLQFSVGHIYGINCNL